MSSVVSASGVAPGETSPGPNGGDIAGSCDINTLQKLQTEHPNGLFLLIAQEGCGDCAEMEKVMNETVGERKPIVKANLTEDKDCLTLAQQVKAEKTPTVIYYEGPGEEVARLQPDGVATWDSFRQKLRELSSRAPAPANEAVSPPSVSPP